MEFPMNSVFKQATFDILTWIIANVICVVVPTVFVHTLGTSVLGWGPVVTSALVSAVFVITLTWGSWAALVWTKTPLIRGLQRFMATLPGISIVAIGVGGFMVGHGAWYFWTAFLGAGLGSVLCTLGLIRYSPAPANVPRRSIGLGLTLFPFLSTGVSLGVWAIWYSFVMNGGGWKAGPIIAAIMMSIMAFALTATVIPALASTGVRRVSTRLKN